LFEVALERPPGERTAMANDLCRGDQLLEAELLRLLKHAGKMASFLEGGATPKARRTFADGQVVAGRYEIIRFLGCGGMGEVYAAQDRALRVAVALKTVRPEIAYDPMSYERLRHEVQMARQVTHPNVCRLFDIGENKDSQGDLLFLTMELLSGQTLAERLAREGPVAEAEAVPIARGIADALEAAHHSGVIHRDLKPANIMMLPNMGKTCRPVVMDFGLAHRVVRSGDTLTAGNLLIGTLAYMAPELIKGAPPSVSSDVYAFGVTLYEMVTGNKPFPSDEALGSALDRSAQDLRKPSEVVKGLSDKWDTTILACLERAPEKRPKSAAQSIRILNGGTTTPVTSRQTRRRIKHQLAVWMMLVFFLALVTFGLRLYLRGPVFPAGTTLMLADIDNATGDRELDALTAVFRNQLEQSAYVQVCDRARAAEVLANMGRPPSQGIRGTIAREVSLRAGVPFVLFGSVAPLAGGLSLNLQLEQLSGTSIFARNSWAFSTQVPGKSQLLDAVHEGSRWVRRILGETARDVATHDRLPQDTTTRSWEALADFGQAERFYAQHQTGAAIALLQGATRYDPNFALAYMRLGDILTSTYRREEGLGYWQLALDETNRQHLTRREELRIRGLYSIDSDDFAAAEAAFAQMEIEYPRDYLPSFYLATALQWEGRLEESVRKLEAADRNQPDSISVIAMLAHDDILLGRYSDVNVQVRRLSQLKYESYAAHYQGLQQFATGDYAGALESFKKESESQELGRRSRGIYYRAGLLCELGRLTEARDVLEKSSDSDINATQPELHAAKLVALAYIDWKTGRRSAARIACLDAASRNPSPELLARAGSLLARIGYQQDARNLAQQLKGAPETRAATEARLRLSGEISLAAGNAKAALVAFKQLDSVAPPLRFREGLAAAYARTGKPETALSYYDTPRSATDLWQALECDYPGLLTDTLFDAAQAALAAGDQQRAQTALSLYFQRRGSGSQSPETVAASRLNKNRI
jgi:hypothetical protein